MTSSRNRNDAGSYNHEKSWIKNINPKLRLVSRAIGYSLSGWGLSLRHGVKQHKAPQNRNRRVSNIELDTLVINSDLPVLGDLYRLAVETAMRQTELAHMHWNDIDLHARTLRIPQPGCHKTRTIPLSRRAVAILQRQVHRPDGLVWGVAPKLISRAFIRAVKRAGIEDLHFHDLRREAISRLHAQGLDDRELAAITGIKDWQSLKRYMLPQAEALVDKSERAEDQRNDVKCDRIG